MPATRDFRQKKESRPYPTVEQLYKKAQPSYANAGGFLIEEDDPVDKNKADEDDLDAKFREAEARLDAAAAVGGSSTSKTNNSTNDDDDDGLRICLECDKPFFESYLIKYFDHPVCDECKDMDEKHALITRTDAKNEFLLQDCDLTSREPKLRFISKKNPHNPRWGDMKLYLRLQVEKRAAEVHGSIETIEETKQVREEKRIEQKRKRFQKKIIELRKTVRSDLYHKPIEIHEHQYGEEQFDSKADTYFRECTVCSHKDVYEKM